MAKQGRPSMKNLTPEQVAKMKAQAVANKAAKKAEREQKRAAKKAERNAKLLAAGKTPKIPYPLPTDATGAVVKLTAIPEDWSARRHEPLEKSMFENEADFWDWKVVEAEGSLDRLRRKAAEIRMSGNADTRRSVKKIAKLKASLEELTEGLRASGVDVDALMALLQKKQESAVAAENTADATLETEPA